MKQFLYVVGILGILVSVAGCGTDVGTPTVENVNNEKAATKQQGQGGVKAAHGGGLTDDKIEPAPAGVKTGLPGPGQKAGG